MGREPIVDGSTSRHAPAVISIKCQDGTHAQAQARLAQSIHCIGSDRHGVCGHDRATVTGETGQVDAAAHRLQWQASAKAPEARLVLRTPVVANDNILLW